jgi:hypothetical protein
MYFGTALAVVIVVGIVALLFVLLRELDTVPPWDRASRPPRRLMDDVEVTFLNLYEDRENVEAFKAGWRTRRDDPETTSDADAKTRGLYPGRSDLRISWGRGYMACHMVHSQLTSPLTIEQAIAAMRTGEPNERK